MRATVVVTVLVATSALGAWWVMSLPVRATPPPSPVRVAPRPVARSAPEPAATGEKAPGTFVFRGRVRDLGGVPVPGAKVTITLQAPDWGEEGESETAVILTDGEGGYELERAAEGRRVDIRVEAPGFVAARTMARGAPLEEREDRAELPIILAPGGSLQGRVTDAEGVPVAGARIEVASADSLDGRGRGVDETRSGEWTLDSTPTMSSIVVLSREDGTYEVDGIPYDIPFAVQAQGGAWRRTSTETEAALTAEAPKARRDLRFPAESRLRVRVLGPDGRPAPAAEVRLDGTGDSQEVVRPLEGPGEFEVRIPFEGPAVVTVRAEDLLAEIRRFDFSAGTVREAEFRLQEGVAIEGTLVDDEGEPKFGVLVKLEREEENPEDPEGRRVVRVHEAEELPYTDLKGHFRFTGLAPGEYLLRTSFGGDARLHRKAPLQAPSSGTRIVLSRWAKARAVVRPAPGESPPRRVTTLVRSAEEAVPIEREWGDGILEWDRLERGDCILEATVAGHVPLQWTFKAVPGEESDLGEAILQRAHVLEGRVVDGVGSPVAGASLQLLDPGRAAREPVRTDDQGRFRIPLLPAGEERLRVSADGFASAILAVAVPSRSATLTLRTGSVVRGKVLLPEGPGPETLAVIAEKIDGESTDRLPPLDVREDGSFETRLPAGRWKFTFPGIEPRSRPVFVDLVDGGSAEVTLDCRE